MQFETFKKLPLGGVDRRSLVGLMKEKGAAAARRQLAEQQKQVVTQGVNIADDMAVVMLGGSNGITRALAVQLLFGEKVPVVGAHYDSAKMQIGVHHAQAMSDAAAEVGVDCAFFNGDATRDKSIAKVVEYLKERYRAVHFINGIAAGATKRYEKHGPVTVCDIDVAFDPVLQVPDFSSREAYRKLGMVEVEVATQAEIDRTNKFMGSSSTQWVEALSEAGLISKGESVVAFCDYDFEADDPVYGMGPLAGAKVLQRQTMKQISERFGIRTVGLCYPAMATTALGAIPGGMLMYALSAQILIERGQHTTLPQLAADTMPLWQDPAPEGELRLDDAYQACLPEFHARKDALSLEGFPGAFAKLFEG